MTATSDQSRHTCSLWPASRLHALTLGPAVVEAILRHVRVELPREAVGLLGADQAGRVVVAEPLPNIARSPRAFLADPIAQFRAEQRLAACGLAACAVYHSHPEGSAAPSPSDHELADRRLVHLIVGISEDGNGAVFRAYRHRGSTLVPLPVEL